MKLEILTDPNSILRQPTEEVARFDMELQTLIDDMVETMRVNDGIGLAAPQVGVSKKIVVCEFENTSKNDYPGFPLTVICNPELKTKSKKECKMVEGCLSFPGIGIMVKRPKDVVVAGKDRYGKPIEIEAEKLFSRVMQHEIDHLNSTLMIDHIEVADIVFFSTGKFGLKTLEALNSDPQYRIRAVVTSSKKTKRRGKSVDSSPVKDLAKKLELDVIEIKSLDEELTKKLKKLKPDLGVVVDFGYIIPKNVFDIPKFGIVNIHPSLLPKYRGPTPIQSAILSGAKKTGVTIIKIDEGIDSGLILSQAEARLTKSANFEILFNYLAEVGAGLLLDTLPYYLSHELKPTKQNKSKASYTKMITKNDGEVTLKTPAIEVERKIRAFYPWPGVYINVNNLIIQITAAHFDREKNLIIDRVKPAGKAEMNYEDFKRGHKTELTFPNS
jgi:methionyl-tRNA formyltransferase